MEFIVVGLLIYPTSYSFYKKAKKGTEEAEKESLI